jgi:hypothetical protein
VTHARSSPGPIPRRRSRAGFIAGVVFGVAALAGAAWWLNPPDPEAELRAHHRPLVTLERKPAPQLGRGFERWLMIAPGPDTMTALWRPGIRTDARPWVAVILGGIGTDDRAAALVPDSLPIGVLAVSWPWRAPGAWDTWSSSATPGRCDRRCSARRERSRAASRRFDAPFPARAWRSWARASASRPRSRP